MAVCDFVFTSRTVRPDMGCIEDKERPLACYRATPLIHAGHAYAERTVAETGGGLELVLHSVEHQLGLPHEPRPDP
jgi:hypothetical protein